MLKAKKETLFFELLPVYMLVAFSILVTIVTGLFFQNISIPVFARYNVSFIVLTILFVTVLCLYLYMFVRKIQGALQEAERTQRICGDNVFEMETMRWVMSKQMSSNPLQFKITFLVIASISALVASCLLISSAFQTERQAFANVILGYVSLTITWGLVAWVTFVFGTIPQNKLSTSVLNDYQKDLKIMKDFFQAVVQTTATNDTVYGAYERFKERIVRRIAKVRNYTSIHDAEDQYDEMAQKDVTQLIGFIEFHGSRDYDILKEMVQEFKGTIKNSGGVERAVEALQNLQEYNPKAQLGKKLRGTYILLAILSFFIGFIWVRLLADNVSHIVIILTFVTVMVAVVFMLA